MAQGNLGVRTITGTTGATAFELIAPVDRGCYLTEMRISLVAATATTLGLGRPAAKGVTPTTPVRLLNSLGGDPFELGTMTAVAWGTPPTIPAAFFRRVTIAGAIGSYVPWVFSKAGILIPAGETLILWNLGTNSILDVDVTVTE